MVCIRCLWKTKKNKKKQKKTRENQCLFFLFYCIFVFAVGLTVDCTCFCFSNLCFFRSIFHRLGVNLPGRPGKRGTIRRLPLPSVCGMIRCAMGFESLFFFGLFSTAWGLICPGAREKGVLLDACPYPVYVAWFAVQWVSNLCFFSVYFPPPGG